LSHSWQCDFDKIAKNQDSAIFKSEKTLQASSL